MRLSKSISKNSINYYIIKDYTKNGKRTTKKVDTIGNYNKIKPLADNENLSVDVWLNKYLQNFIHEHSHNDGEEVIIRKNTKKLIPKNHKNSFNVGYLFLEDIYYDLKLNEICKFIEDKYSFKFDLNEILSYLEYSRIIFPSSKAKTHELSKKFIEAPDIQLHTIYRGLTYLNKEMDYIQEQLYKNSLKVVDRNSRVIYFDCTNFYFEIDQETDIQKYGINKQHQPSPQVGMGLFMDGDGLPLSINLFPGNESESKQLIDPETKIVNNFKLNDTRIVICTDAALCTDEIKNYNIQNGRSFVITQSIKKLKELYQEEVFKNDNWRIIGDLKNVYDINKIQNDEKLSKQFYDTIFYKIIQTETAHVKQDLIVTFSLKYRDYHRELRINQLNRAQNKINNNTKGEKISLNHNQNDYRRFIKEEVTVLENKDNNSEKSKKDNVTYSYAIDEILVQKEARYDGYYGLTTNLNDDIETILKVAKGRWEIEESFRIMKSDFLSRPVNLSREDRIKAHFLTCFIALLIYRILEKKLDFKYTTSQILDTLKHMYVLELKGDGYVPSYERTDLTDDLHEVFGFRTDYELINYKKYEKIFKQLKE